MAKGYLTTFQAAELMSVTPDSILKWIKSGKLKARRTPGGHYRISRKIIEDIIDASEKLNETEQDSKMEITQHCWEFNSNNELCTSNCDECVVFKARAERCYEMNNLPSEYGNLRLFCKSSCEECKFYKFSKSQN